MKIKTLVTGGLVLIMGIVSGGAAGYEIGRSEVRTVKPANQQTAVKQNKSEEKNLYNGDELTLAEMYDSIQSVTGDDFDWRLLVYLTSIRNIESGMLREAETKAKHQRLKELAKIQREQNEKVLPLLNQWQSDWGYSHH